MKILFVWTGVTSYMADCWRELAKRPEVDLRVVIERHSSGAEIDVGNVLKGFDAKVVDHDANIELGGWMPDAIFAVGWHSTTVRKVVKDGRYRDIPKVCCFDMPWRWLPRCIAARWVLRRFLKNYAASFVPGERAARYARWLGFRSIHNGLFSLDSSRFSGDAGRRDFMFIGRDAPEKRMDLLKAAYRRYRGLGGKWGFDIYGGTNFVQPSDVPNLYRTHACLLLASSFDPWPLVMLEATTAGLTVIASDRCGNVDELGAVKVKYGDADAIAEAMLRVERGECSQSRRALAEQYDCRVWADRVLNICGELGGSK